jgi:hypothetical protein
LSVFIVNRAEDLLDRLEKGVGGGKSVLELFDTSPELVIYEGTAERGSRAPEEDLGITGIVLESLLNVLAEDVSRREFTHSDVVRINDAVMNRAAEVIAGSVAGDSGKLERLRKFWVSTLVRYLKQITKDREVQTDEAVYLVGSHFRISALSAIRALKALLP